MRFVLWPTALSLTQDLLQKTLAAAAADWVHKALLSYPAGGESPALAVQGASLALPALA